MRTALPARAPTCRNALAASPARTPTCRNALAALRTAAILAALCAARMAVAAEAKLVFGTGLSIDGITFAPHAFNMTWNGFGALGRPDLDAASGDSGESPVLSRHFTLRTGTTDDAPLFSGTGSFSETPEGAIRAAWTMVADKAGAFAEAFVGSDVPFSRVGGGAALLDGRELPCPPGAEPRRTSSEARSPRSNCADRTAPPSSTSSSTSRPPSCSRTTATGRPTTLASASSSQRAPAKRGGNTP